jgi:hypothetical protein
LTTPSKVADKVRVPSGYCKPYFLAIFLPYFLAHSQTGQNQVGKAGGDPKKMTFFWAFFEVGLRILLWRWWLHPKTGPKKIIPKNLR